MSETYDLVKRAIIEKLQVIAAYDGCQREMCPHVIGTKYGREQCLFFQFAGKSRSGLPAGGQWRCIPIAGLSNVSVRAGEWHTGLEHTQAQTCVDCIDTEVAH